MTEGDRTNVLPKRQTRWRPDSLWSCLVCTASAVSLVIVSGGTYSFGLLLPSLMEHFNESRQAIAWVGSLCMASGYFLSPLSSFIAERSGYRFASIVASFSCIIGFCLASFSSKLWMMYPTYSLLAGFGYNSIYSYSYLVVLQYFVKWRSVAIGLVSSCTAFGIFAMAQITQALLDSFGWRGAIRGFAVLYVVCGLCSTVYVPINQPQETTNNNAPTPEKGEKKASEASILRNKAFWILAASLNIIFFSYYVPTVHIIKHCEQALHIPGNKASLLFTYWAIASFFSRHFFCKLGDFKFISRYCILLVSMTVSGVSVLLLPIATTFTAVLVLFVVHGLMDGGLHGQFALLIFECVGLKKVNLAWGCLCFFLGISISTGVPLAGLIADKLGSYAVAFYATGTFSIAGASMMLLMPLVQEPIEEHDKNELDDNSLEYTEFLTVV